MAFDFNQSLPDSFKSPLIPAKTEFLGADTKGLYEKTDFGIDTVGVFEDTSLAGLNAFGMNPQPAWTFITAPADVSWDVANQASRVDVFGSNNPPVVAGSRGMRDLTLSDSLVEGFVRNVTVGKKIAALEDLMKYGLNTSDGFVSVPVYQVWANSRSYGGPEAYYIIKDVKVKEKMRDLKGDTTRASVDVSLMQVPSYQVNSGRDQANEKTADAGSVLKRDAEAAKTGTDGKKAANAANTSVDGQIENKKSGPNAGGAATPTPPSQKGQTGGFASGSNRIITLLDEIPLNKRGQ